MLFALKKGYVNYKFLFLSLIILGLGACKKLSENEAGKINSSLTGGVAGNTTVTLPGGLTLSSAVIPEGNNCFITLKNNQVTLGEFEDNFSSIPNGTTLTSYTSNNLSVNGVTSFESLRKSNNSWLYADEWSTTENISSSFVLNKYLTLTLSGTPDSVVSASLSAHIQKVECVKTGSLENPWMKESSVLMPRNQDCYFDFADQTPFKFSELSNISGAAGATATSQPKLTVFISKNTTLPTTSELMYTAYYVTDPTYQQHWYFSGRQPVEGPVDNEQLSKRFVIRTERQNQDLIFNTQKRVNFYGCYKIGTLFTPWVYPLAGHLNINDFYLEKNSSLAQLRLSDIETTKGFFSPSNTADQRHAEVHVYSSFMNTTPTADSLADEIYFRDASGTWRKDIDGYPAVNPATTLISKNFVIRVYKERATDVGIARTSKFNIFFLGPPTSTPW